MKKLYLTLCLLMATMFLTAQDVPQAINFQAIARDANSEVMANTPIMIQLTILDGTPDGELVYREIRSLTTNAYGSFSFQIGRDPYMSDGNLADIDWGGGRKFLKIDYDPTATLSFDLSLGTVEFVSVPYAFAAGSVSYIDATGANDGDVLAYNATTGRFEPVAMSIPDFEESDPTVPAWAKVETKPTYDYSEIQNTPNIPTIPTAVSTFENDANYLTSESDPTVPAWAKANAKPVYDYSEITNTPAIPTVPTNVSAFTNDANYVVNEADPTVPAWAKANAKPVYDYSEITNTPAIPTVPTNVSAFTNDANYVVNESDPTVPTWAKAENKPVYDYSEIENTPDLFDGNYNSLTNTPDLSEYITTENQTIADAAALGNSVNTQLKNLTDPTENQDAATKKYVDDLIAALQAQNEVLQTAIRALTTGTLNDHYWVDLGLPSGTKWATCNVGADSPEEYGDYFAWGETTAKTTYDWSTYRYCNGSYSKLTKYCNNSSYGNNGFTDALTTLEASDDAATANWGSGWRMPTQTEMQELIDNCTVTWTTQNGVNGRLFTGPNGNSIFLPAAGYRYGSELSSAGSFGYYWSSSLYTDGPRDAWYLYFYSGNYRVDSIYRRYGLSVRPVCASQN